MPEWLKVVFPVNNSDYLYGFHTEPFDLGNSAEDIVVYSGEMILPQYGNYAR